MKPTPKELAAILTGSANILKEMTDPDELQSRDMTREEAVRDMDILRSCELVPAGTHDVLRAVTNNLKRAGYTATDIISEIAALVNRDYGRYMLAQAQAAELDALRVSIAELEAERDVYQTLHEEACNGQEFLEANSQAERNSIAHAADRVVKQAISERDDLRARLQLIGWDTEANEYDAEGMLTIEAVWLELRAETESRKHAQSERDALREQVTFEQRQKILAGSAVIKAETERDDFHATVCKHECTIGSLISLIASGSGEDSYEYEYALELIGAPPVGDVSAPEQPPTETEKWRVYRVESGWLITVADGLSEDDAKAMAATQQGYWAEKLEGMRA